MASGEGTLTEIFTLSPERKRKLDEDGFKTPATPDIPVTSLHHKKPTPPELASCLSYFTTNDNEDGNDFLCSKLFGTDDDTFPQAGTVAAIPGDPSREGTVVRAEDGISLVTAQADDGSVMITARAEEGGLMGMARAEDLGVPGMSRDGALTPDAKSRSQNSQDSSNSSNPESEVTIPDDESGSDVEPARSVSDVIKSMEYRVKQVSGKWMTSFREAEKMEEMLPARIDALLDEALSLERHLLQQKEEHKCRLAMLGNALHML